MNSDATPTDVESLQRAPGKQAKPASEGADTCNDALTESPRFAASLGRLWRRWGTIRADMRMIRGLPEAQIDLMRAAAQSNDPFYLGLVDDFYRYATSRRRSNPLVRNFTTGVCLCRLPAKFEHYFMKIDAAARRNVKKARRLGYSWSPIDFNAHLADIAEIRRSTPVRQGRVGRELLADAVSPCTDPPPRSPEHGYPFFGVLREGKLLAYCGCFVCGEICMIEHVLGHALYQPDGIVPMLIVETAQHLIEQRPQVKYYSYGGYFGASETLRRFKRKFLFDPHRVTWTLSGNMLKV